MVFTDQHIFLSFPTAPFPFLITGRCTAAGVADKQSAIQFAIKTSEEGSYVVIFADDAIQTLKIVQNVTQFYND